MEKYPDIICVERMDIENRLTLLFYPQEKEAHRVYLHRKSNYNKGKIFWDVDTKFSKWILEYFTWENIKSWKQEERPVKRRKYRYSFLALNADRPDGLSIEIKFDPEEQDSIFKQYWEYYQRVFDDTEDWYEKHRKLASENNKQNS